MSEPGTEIDRAIVNLGLEDRLRPVPRDEARRLYLRLEARFCSKSGSRWLWEHLRQPFATRRFDDDRAFERLSCVVPSTEQSYLFFPESDEDDGKAYRGDVDAIAGVIGECPPFEYVITTNDLDWLVCENHHGALFAAGEPVEDRLLTLEFS